jgi:hypothetical protein
MNVNVLADLLTDKHSKFPFLLTCLPFFYFSFRVMVVDRANATVATIQDEATTAAKENDAQT